MSPAEQIAARYGEQARVESAYGQETVDVPATSWVDALTAARDELGFSFFDWLTAVDQTDAAEEPGFDVVCHLWSVDRSEHLFLRTRVPEAGSLGSATGTGSECIVRTSGPPKRSIAAAFMLVGRSFIGSAFG